MKTSVINAAERRVDLLPPPYQVVVSHTGVYHMPELFLAVRPRSVVSNRSIAKMLIGMVT